MAHPSIADRPSDEPSEEPADVPPVTATGPVRPERDAGAVTARLVTAVSSSASLVWIIAVALSARHGFDTSDEGYYLLSYRWWNVNDRTFTGIQYLYGPVFEALGWNIAGLRLFRLLTVVVTLAAFGWTFMRWLRTRRPKATPSRWWEAAGTATIVAAGGAVYGWLPLTPGYNDVSLLGAVLCMAVVFRSAAATERGERVPAWVPIAAGPLIFAMVLAKWSSSMVVVFVSAVALVIVLWPRGWREILRFVGLTVAGTVVGALLMQLLLVRLTDVIPHMLEINRIVAGKTNSPTKLISMYADTTYKVVRLAVRTHVWILVAVIVAVLARGKWAVRLAAILGAAGVTLSALRMIEAGGLTGGTVNLRSYPATLFVLVLVTVVTAVAVLVSERLRKRRESSLIRAGWREWFLLVVLLGMPYLQALGTGNAIHVMAVNGFALWAAAAIAVITGMERVSRVARTLMVAATATGVAAAACIGLGGSLLHPYRTSPYAKTTAVVADVPALSSIRLSHDMAAKYSGLHSRLEPYLTPGRAIMGYDEMAGVVLLLDGRPVGEAWYSASDRARTAAGITATCRDDKWFGSQPPLLLFRRPVSAVDVNALGSCGLDFTQDYTLLAPAQETMGIAVYVPTAEKESR